MKKILLSLLIIAGISGAMVLGTRAFFNDTETSPDNTLAAGTIDISVDGQNPWSKTYLTTDLDDLKPGMSKTISFPIKNEGINDLVLWKRINITRDGGLETEPEIEAENGNSVDNIDTQIHYDMTVGGFNTIPESWGIMMSDIDKLWIPLGKITPGAELIITQVYKFDEKAGNEYQGDKIIFDIDLYAEQLLGPGPESTRGVVLENKSLDPDWYALMDGTWGIVTWDDLGNYKLRSWGLNDSYTYRIAYWNGSTELGISSYGSSSSGYLEQTGTYAAFTTNTDAKYWLRPNDWDNDKTLWESNLVN